MTVLFKKLNYKNEGEIWILNGPYEFQEETTDMSEVALVHTNLTGSGPIGFVLAFVKTEGEIVTLLKKMHPRLEGDATVWFAYPKKSSRKYVAKISRDSGWSSLRQVGFESVRAVAIDENWSALRFRKVEYIKSMARNPKRTMTKKGKEKDGGAAG